MRRQSFIHRWKQARTERKLREQQAFSHAMVQIYGGVTVEPLNITPTIDAPKPGGPTPERRNA